MEGGESMIINHNVSALFASRALAQTERQISKSIEKLASGLRINRAGDDASGLAVSETLRSQIRGLRQAQRNAFDSISFIQTAEGSLQEVHSILHRLRELAIQSANAIYSEQDRSLIQVEVSQLVLEINRIAETTEFNRFKILDGSQESLAMMTMTPSAIGVSGLSMETVSSANEALGKIDEAVDTVSRQRANFGAVQNRLEHVVSSLAVAEENLQAAESRIRDTNMASEIVNFMRLKILQDSGAAMLMQANLRPESVMRLLD
jgi:flagellin